MCVCVCVCVCGLTSSCQSHDYKFPPAYKQDLEYNNCIFHKEVNSPSTRKEISWVLH